TRRSRRSPTRSASVTTSCRGWGERAAVAMAAGAPQSPGDDGIGAGRNSVVSASSPATRTEIGVVYFAGIVPGLALVTFQAASSIFTRPVGFGFDSTRYGAMFVPQVVLAVLASGLAPKLARRWNLRRVLLAGIAGDIVSMALLALSRLMLGAPD